MAISFSIPITGSLILDSSTRHSLFIHSASSSVAVMLLLLVLVGRVVGGTTTEVNVGVVLDMDSWVGKVGWTSINISLSDFYAAHPSYHTRLKLNLRGSKSDDVAATAAAIDLIKNKQVQAIIGPERSTQAEFVIHLGDKANVPIISFSATSPSLSTSQHPYFIRAAQDDSSQVNAISALVQAYGWREAVLMYVDNEFGQGLVPSLTYALDKVNTRVTCNSVVSPSASDDQILAELDKLSRMQTRVFIVHMAPALASRLFRKVKEAGMMSGGYVWIMTTGMTDLFSSIDDRVVTTSMQGVLGVKNHAPDTPTLDNFTARWKMKFHQDYPSVMNPTMNMFGLWAYDAAFALAMTAEVVSTMNFTFRNTGDSTNSTTDLETLGVSENGQKLLQALRDVKFPGLAGEFDLLNGQLKPSAFEIVNINGNGARTIGFWTPLIGLLKDLVRANTTGSATNSTSSSNLGSIIWPGDPLSVPKGWEIPIRGQKLKIGVPVMGGFSEFVTVTRDPDRNKTEVTGYCIDIFKAVLRKLPYSVPHEFVPFAKPDGTSAGTYNDMIDQVCFQKYDAVVGDTTIIANRSLYVDFTLPYTESGVWMIVPNVNSGNDNAWVFLKPLTWQLWLTAFLFFVFIGLVVWTLEHRINEDFRGPASQQVGRSLWFSFSTMVFAQRERVVSNSARFVVIVWVFVVLILSQSYTASLSSLLVMQNLQPSMTDIYELLRSRQTVGYKEGSFVYEKLKQMKFDDNQLKSYESAEECSMLLSKGGADGGVAAVIDEAPYMTLLLSQTGNKYTSIPTFKTAGFGFVFPLGSPLVPDISRAILNVTEGQKMLEIEKRWFNRTNSRQDSSGTSVTSNSNSLSMGSFWGLFLIAGVASLLALLASIAIFLKRNWYISSGDSFKEKMVDLGSRFFQKDMTSHTFQQLGTSQDGISENGVRGIDIVSDNGNFPHSLARDSTETEDAPGEQRTQAADRDMHANSTEGGVSMDVVIETELVASANHENNVMV